MLCIHEYSLKELLEFKKYRETQSVNVKDATEETTEAGEHIGGFRIWIRISVETSAIFQVCQVPLSWISPLVGSELSREIL